MRISRRWGGGEKGCGAGTRPAAPSQPACQQVCACQAVHGTQETQGTLPGRRQLTCRPSPAPRHAVCTQCACNNPRRTAPRQARLTAAWQPGCAQRNTPSGQVQMLCTPAAPAATPPLPCPHVGRAVTLRARGAEKPASSASPLLGIQVDVQHHMPQPVQFEGAAVRKLAEAVGRACSQAHDLRKHGGRWARLHAIAS